MNNIPIVDRFLELDIALQAVTEAGNAILDIYGRKYETSTKHDDSPITEADLIVDTEKEPLSDSSNKVREFLRERNLI